MAKNDTIIKSEFEAVPPVVGCKPVGSQVLFEELTQKELLGTNLVISGNTGSKSAPQAYITALGPKVDPEWGLKVGQRVVISGTFTPIPEISGSNGRRTGVCDPFNIKAVLIEKGTLAASKNA